LRQNAEVFTVSGFNPLECIKDALAVAKDLSNFLSDYNSGKDIGSLISDLTTIVNDLQSALPACGAGKALIMEKVEVGGISECI